MPQQPNILLITSDQQHWSTLGCLHPELETPNLDRLVKEGTRFNRAYCPNPTCTPTRASIITGKYPSQHGAYSLGTKLQESEHTVGEDLQEAGYRTALVGKAHFQQTRTSEAYPSIESHPLLRDLDYWREFNGPFYGFEHVELARNHADEHLAGQHYAIWMEEKGLRDWEDHFQLPDGSRKGQKYKWSIPEAYHYGTWIAERSCALIDDYTSRDEPFFLWSSFFDPHPPYLVPEPWDTMYDPASLTVPSGMPGEHDLNPPHFKLTQERNPDFSPWKENEWGLHGFRSHLRDPEDLAKDIAVYYGMISLMDKQIGLILDKLDATGEADNTLVVFTSDHGHFYGQHGLTAKGAFQYEDAIRVPFLAKHPGCIPAGESSESIQSLVDLAPTFLSTAGIPIPGAMSGIDQTEVWRGETECVRDHALCEHRHTKSTVHLKTYVDKRYKLTTYFGRDYGQLFDLESDPDEFHNLWDDPTSQSLKSDIFQKLIHAEMGKEPMWMPRISGA